MVIQAVSILSRSLSWRAKSGFVLALVLSVSACQGPEPEERRPTSKAENTANEKSEVTSAQATPETGPAWQVEKPSGGVPTEVSPSRSLLSGPEYYQGTGVLASTRTRQSAVVPVSESGQVSLNFFDVDIREVIDVVLGDTLNLSYSIDPEVQGTVIARTSEPLDREDVISALENILTLNGAAMRLADGVYHIMPLEKAARGPAQSRTADAALIRGKGFTVTVIPLRYASASAIRKIAANFVASERILLSDPTRNLLIFAGTATEADNLVELIRRFDVDWMAGMSFALFPVEIADATTMASELEKVFGQGQVGALEDVIRFLPIDRMNAVLAISPQPGYLERAGLWVERLDRGESAAGRQIYVYYVQNSRAAELAEVLTQIFETGGASTTRDTEPVFAPGITPVELSGPRVGEQSAEAGAIVTNGSSQPSIQEASLPGESQTQSPTGSAGVGFTLSEGSNIRVIPDEKNNALVILATATEYRMVEATLERLDIIPLQVLIEATIAEVTLSDQLRYGLNWFFQQGDFDITFSDLSSGDVASAFPGFSALFSSSNAQVVLNALTNVTDINVVSSPQLMVLDNQSAFLNVGDQVPILTQSQTSSEGASVTETIEYRDTGVTLEITPRVNSSGLVVLDIVQEVSDVITTETSDIDSPTIQQRRIESTVAVQSGEAIALGGLIRDNRVESLNGVPLLSDIPIFGNLFKTTTETSLRTELLILITPRVIRNVQEATEAMNELRARMLGLMPLEQRIKRTQSLPEIQ